MAPAMENPWVIFTFLSLFHVIGAAVLAHSVLELWRGARVRDGRGCRMASLVIWASIFGCLPFAFGMSLARSKDGTPLVLVAEGLVWIGAFSAVILARDAIQSFAEPFLRQETLLMLFGGVFITAGLAIATLLATEERLPGLVTGGSLTLVGGGVFAYGLWQLLKSTK